MSEVVKFGIEETLEVLDAGISLGNAVDTALADDGKVTWTEYGLFLPVITKLPKAISGIADVPKELTDLDESEQEQVKQFIADKLDLGNDAAEAKIEAVFAGVMELFVTVLNLVQVIRA